MVDGEVVGCAHADLVGIMAGSGLHEAKLFLAAHHAVDHPDRGDHAAVLVEMRIEDERLERGVGITLGRRGETDDGVEEFGHAFAGLGRDAENVVGRDAEHVLDLGCVAIGFGGGQVDLVEAGDDFEVVLHRQVAVGEGLSLDPLSGVDHEDDAFAGGERAADLVAEIDVAGCVDQVDHMVVPVETHRLELDRDAAFSLEIHRVEVLGAHVPSLDGPGQLQHAIRERGLPVIDMGDDRRVTDALEFHAGIRASGAMVPRRTVRGVRGASTLPTGCGLRVRSGVASRYPLRSVSEPSRLTPVLLPSR